MTFRNEKTHEYLFYNIHFKATPPGIISSIDLSTPVRKSVSHRVTVDNPLPTQVTFHTNVNTTDISLPATFEAGAESEVSWGEGEGLQGCSVIDINCTLRKVRTSGGNMGKVPTLL